LFFVVEAAKKKVILSGVERVEVLGRRDTFLTRHISEIGRTCNAVVPCPENFPLYIHWVPEMWRPVNIRRVFSGS
jgi:hypothetical protein